MLQVTNIIYGYVQPSNHIYSHRQPNLIAKKRNKKKTAKNIVSKKRPQFSVCASSFMLTTHVRLQPSNFEMISNIGLSRHFKSSFKLILYIRNIYFWQRLSFISICFLLLCCDVVVLKLL
jgi:hypothetical protein